MAEKLFAEFPPVSTSEWEAVITADLKGADYDKKLVWRSPEGFAVRPYYRAEDLKELKFLAAEPAQFPFVRGTRANNQWMVHQTVIATEAQAANTLAHKILMTGIDSLEFHFPESGHTAEGLDAILKGISLVDVAVTFSGCGIADVAELMIAKIERDKLPAGKLRINFCIDPLVTKLTQKGAFGCCADGSKCFERIAALCKSYAMSPNVRLVSAQGQTFSNAGSTIVEELAFTLAAGHEYLSQLIERGIAVDEAASRIRFSMSVTANYFMEIAKFRAARMLWANIVKAYAPKCDCAGKMFAHAVTSTWNQTAYDPYVNMLRGTTEAMSASIAGVDSLEVTPFDASFETPTEFSMRIARNVELLLKNESHFDQVTDPSGGSYYIENLTASIAAEAWKLFREIEDKGGYTKAYMDGFIAERVKASAAAKDKNIATRREILLGANQYPNFTEVAPKEVTARAVERPAAPAAEGNTLLPYRGAMAFEEMRLHVDRSGKAPKAFMLTCGNLAMARARSQFACNFFACAGIRVVDNTFFKSVEEGVKAALDAKAEIVVVCAADDDYAEVAPRINELLGGKAITVIAGAPASQPELEAKGITHFISVKSNVLETLKGYLKELGIKNKGPIQGGGRLQKTKI